MPILRSSASNLGLQNFSWDLLANHKCDPSSTKNSWDHDPSSDFFAGIGSTSQLWTWSSGTPGEGGDLGVKCKGGGHSLGDAALLLDPMGIWVYFSEAEGA